MRGDIIPPSRDGNDGRPRERASEDTSPQNPSQSPVKPLGTKQSDQTVAVAPHDVDDVTLIENLQDKDDAMGNTETKRKKIPLLVTVIGIILAVCIALIATAIVWYNHQLSAVDAKSDEKVAVTIEPGSGLSHIASTLKESNLIRNEIAFEWYVRQSGKTSSLQSGSYRLGRSESVPAIVKHLTSGNTDTFSITFLPGATLAKHRQVLLDAGYQADEVDAALLKQYTHPVFEGKPAEADLEGYIYGETYNFPANATVEQILTRTFDQLEQVVTKNDLINKYKQQGFNLYQGITLASIIQREVATPEDAAQVAQVFKKRYDLGMQLGSDVTYQYIADKTGVERSVDIDSPYNTRRYAGLPPGPISSPGLASLLAVGSPAPGDYLYFLSGDDDKTYFANTNEEHEQNIRDHCQKKCQII